MKKLAADMEMFLKDTRKLENTVETVKLKTRTTVPFVPTTPEEQAIQGVMDQIWETYDVDNSGCLDKEDTKKFV